MDQLALLLFIAYLAYLAYRGVKGGEIGMQSHLMLLWAIIALGNVVGLIYLAFRG